MKNIFKLIIIITLTISFANSTKAWSCGDTFTDTRDGKVYTTVQIGNQCWMAENLNVGTKIDVLDENYDINFQDPDCVNITKYCFNSDISNCDTYGGLYQWWHATCSGSWEEEDMIEHSCNGTGEPPNDSCSNPIQGICPTGWHIPSVYEMTTLLRAVCTSDTCNTDFAYDLVNYEFLGTTEGDKLKKAGLCEGRTPCGTSGFDMLLGGFLSGYDYSFDSELSLILISSYIHVSPIMYVNMIDFSQIYRDGYNAQNGLPVRCLKDPAPPENPVPISPSNNSITNNTTPTLSSVYADSDFNDTGTTNYRISSSSLSDCINNINIIVSGTSPETSTNNENTTFIPSSPIENDGTYYWCAQNDDGIDQSVWTAMGTFILDTTPPQTPIANPVGTTYNSTQNITLSSQGSNAIYYTTDGSIPTTSSTLYTGAIEISTTTTLKAISTDQATNESGIMTQVYTMELTTSSGTSIQPQTPPTTEGDNNENNNPQTQDNQEPQTEQGEQFQEPQPQTTSQSQIIIIMQKIIQVLKQMIEMVVLQRS